VCPYKLRLIAAGAGASDFPDSADQKKSWSANGREYTRKNKEKKGMRDERLILFDLYSR
jgi:hypothetical protein